MYFQRSVIGWTPGGKVDVVSSNEYDRLKWFDEHPIKISPAWATKQLPYDISGESAKLAVLALFHTLVVRDKIDPLKAHWALMDIKEYRDAIATDTLAADVPRYMSPRRKFPSPQVNPASAGASTV
jgi:hypothetical protein